jgi:hypothetical protein
MMDLSEDVGKYYESPCRVLSDPTGFIIQRLHKQGYLFLQDEYGNINLWVIDPDEFNLTSVQRNHPRMEIRVATPFLIVDNTPKPKRFRRRLRQNDPRFKGLRAAREYWAASAGGTEVEKITPPDGPVGLSGELRCLNVIYSGSPEK